MSEPLRQIALVIIEVARGSLLLLALAWVGAKIWREVAFFGAATSVMGEIVLWGFVALFLLGFCAWVDEGKKRGNGDDGNS